MRFPTILCAMILFASTVAADAAWIGLTNPREEAPAVLVSRVATGTWQVRLTVPGVSQMSVQGESGMFDRIELPGEPVNGRDGEAELPLISRLIILQSDGDPYLELVSQDWVELDGTFDLAAGGEAGPGRPLDDYSTRDEFLPLDVLNVSPRQVLGGVPFAAATVRPVQYNPAQRRVRVLRAAEMLIHESGSGCELPAHVTETTAALLRALSPNWQETHLDDEVVKGTLLYIIPNNSDVPSNIYFQQLVTWRTRKGYAVVVAGPNEIGSPLTTTNVKAKIQQVYDNTRNTDHPLEFVGLVGDATGTYTIPTYRQQGFWYLSWGAGDFQYTQLEGNDLVPDVGMGRYCFSSTTEMALQLKRTITYERTPSAPSGGSSHPDWYRGGGLFVDGTGSGISPIFVMRWIRERMLDVGFTSSSIDTVYTSGCGTQMNNSINSGISLFFFRGYDSFGGWNNSDASGLTNVGRWPFMMGLTCNTNDFDDGSDDYCEAFLKAGTVASPTGCIGIIGQSSIDTRTRYNNTLLAGAAQALLREDIHTQGGALSRARVEMVINYPLPADTPHVRFFNHITALLGDPAVDVYTGTPETLYVNNPASIPIGTNTLTLVVTNAAAHAIEGAYVNLVKGSEVFTGQWTDVNGRVVFNFVTTSAETLFVTATKHNARPAVNYTLVTSSTMFVSPPSASFPLDDDSNPPSSGNGDGRANPGETLEMSVSLKNWGTTIANSVTGVLSITDPLATISQSTRTYGNIAAGATASPSGPYVFSLASYAPDGYTLQFTLTASDNAAHTWLSAIPIRIANGALAYVSSSLSGVGNGILDPGESGQLTLTLTNAGLRATPAGATAYLRSGRGGVPVTDSVGTFTSAAPAGQCNNAGNTFGITATSNAFPGERIPFTVIFPLNGGFADTVLFSLVIGSVSSSSPTPPDEYGYWAFDDTDVAFAKHPSYNWVEIDSRFGGSGTTLGITDAASERDTTVVVNLPFTFVYYGQSYTQICVCSNGWIAMGGDQAVHRDFRNYNIPSALGPDALIAPFWDDLLVTHTVSLMTSEEGDENAVQKESNEWLVKGYSSPAEESRGGSLDQGNDACPATVISSLPYADTGTTAGRANDYSGSCVGSSAPDVIYQFTAAATDSYRVSLCGSSYDTGLIIKTGGSCPGTTQVACNDDYSGCGTQSQVTFQGTASTIYYIIVDGWGTTSGSYTLSVTQVVDECSQATVISSIPYSNSGSSCSHQNACGNTAPDVMYRYTVPAAGESLAISLCNSSFDTYLRVRSTCCGTQLASDDDGCANMTSRIQQYFAAGEISIQVEGYGSACGNYTLDVQRYVPPVAGTVCTYHDAANHRFIIQWSRAAKFTGYNGAGPYPEETFECILKQPGYPATPTGDGEILFQYLTCANVVDESGIHGAESNDYATVGIENLDHSDGVLYSYYNMTSSTTPGIPGAAAMTNCRAILFTTQRMPPTTPRAPTGLVTTKSGNDLLLAWNPVRYDVDNNPITVSGYKIYGGTVPGFTPAPENLMATVPDTSYLRTGIPDGAKYFYAVQAYFDGGLESVAAPGEFPTAIQSDAAAARESDASKH
jgi:hypothetical protein